MKADTLKQCSKCKLWHSRNEFAANRSKASGLQSYCKQCVKGYDKNRDMSQRYERAGALEKSVAYKRAWRYGLTVCELTRMRISQMDGCAVCGDKAFLHIDHCHTSGAVRGLLCAPCNKGLGFFKDNVERLRSAVQYLTPAQ